MGESGVLSSSPVNPYIILDSSEHLSSKVLKYIFLTKIYIKRAILG